MRTVIESEELGGRLAAFLQKDPDNVDRQCADLQRSLDRLAQLFGWMVFQKPQDLDELTMALATRFRFEPTSKDGEAVRKFPLLERFAKVERVRLTL